MCLAQGPQRSDASEARTRSPTVSSQALYHWATTLPSRSDLTHVGPDLDPNCFDTYNVLENSFGAAKFEK